MFKIAFNISSGLFARLQVIVSHLFYFVNSIDIMFDKWHWKSKNTMDYLDIRLMLRKTFKTSSIDANDHPKLYSVHA